MTLLGADAVMESSSGLKKHNVVEPALENGIWDSFWKSASFGGMFVFKGVENCTKPIGSMYAYIYN